MAKTGRPKITIDWDVVKRLCNLQCTQTEIASVVNVSEDTLVRRIKSKYNLTYAEYYKKESAGGKASLRRAQWKKAIGTKDSEGKDKNDGSVPMLIWLGKQYLGQAESPLGDVNELCEGFDLDEI
tara:strand:+ start:655 stop:1029 length:375 start_codon:yes stop_codon:yes gene_type:complete